MTEQPIETERYLKFTLVYILTTILADGIGLTLGSLLDPVVSIIRVLMKMYLSITEFLIEISLEWNIRGRYCICFYACVQWFLSAQQSHSKTDENPYVSIVDELLTWGISTVYIRLQSIWNAMPRISFVLSLQVSFYFKSHLFLCSKYIYIIFIDQPKWSSMNWEWSRKISKMTLAW